jgi:hypothetical protein
LGIDASSEVQSVCGYLLGDPCSDSENCVQGLVCLNQTCTLSCTVREGFSDFCEAELSDPFNRAWYTKPEGAAPLQSGACVDGICVWK